ncbi:MAG: response regulator [Burkholderiales bacterium]|nr:response regulator [Burkholderiales bacterium]
MSAWAGREALAADDNEDSRKLASLMLKRAGFTVHQAEDGAQALACARNSALSVILMDLEMPVMSGLEAIRAIRAEAASPGVRIIGLSAHADQRARDECLAAGADDYLVKPLRGAELTRILERFIGAA